MFSSNTSVLDPFWNHLAFVAVIKQKGQLLVNKAVGLFWEVPHAKSSFLLEENDLVMFKHETVISVWLKSAVLLFLIKFSLQGS